MLVISFNEILGICLGLYFKNIALFVLIIYFFILLKFESLVKNFSSIKNFNNYNLKFRKLLIIGYVICILFVLITIKNDYNYESLYESNFECKAILKVISFKEEKNYTNRYLVKVKSINFNSKYKDTKLLLYTSKDIELEYGDLISIDGEFSKASSKRNSNGFDYERYLRQNKIYGIINSKTVQIIKNEKTLFSIISKFRQNLIKNLFKIFDKNYASFLSGLLIGDKSNIEDEMSESFRNSSLSHVLAISGMHVVYIINRS